MQHVSAGKLRSKFSYWVQRVAETREPVAITNFGSVVAILAPASTPDSPMPYDQGK